MLIKFSQSLLHRGNSSPGPHQSISIQSDPMIRMDAVQTEQMQSKWRSPSNKNR